MSSTDPSPSPTPSPSSRPGLISRTLRRQTIGMLAVTVLGSLVLWALVYQQVKPHYKALNLLRADPLVADLYNTRAGVESIDSYLQTQVQLITSPNVLTAAGTNPKVAVLDRVQKAGDVVQELRDAVNVVVIPNTYLIEVSVTSPDGAEAATIVNAVVDAFMEANGEWSDGMTRAQIKNLEAYNVDLKKQLDELERKWKQLAAKGHDPVPLEPLPDRVKIRLDEYRQLYRQLNSVKLELAEAEAWLNAAKTAIDRAGKPGDQTLIDEQVKRKFKLDPEVIALAAQMSETTKMVDAQRKAPANDPAVKAAQRKLDALRAKWQQLWDIKSTAIREQIEHDPDHEIKEASDAVKKLVVKQTALKQEFGQLDMGNNRLTDSFELALMEDERKNLKEMQGAVVRRIEQLRFEAKGEARIRPVNPNGAMIPTRPISDKRPGMLGAIPFAMMFASFALFLGVEACSTPKATPVEPEPTGEVAV